MAETKCKVYTSPINAKEFGAVGDGITDDTAALQSWFSAVCLSIGARGYLPAGRYKCLSSLTFDLSQADPQGRVIYGDGAQSTIIDLTSASANPPLLLHCTSPSAVFYWCLSDFGIVGNNPSGAVFAIGRTSWNDHFNSCAFDRITVNNINTANSPSAVGVQINGCFSCSFRLVVSNCGSPAYGDAFQINHSGHCSYEAIAGGNALNAIHIANHFSYGNSFTSPDFEVVTNCVNIDSNSGGTNSFVGGQWHYTGYGISASPTSGHEITSPNVGGPLNSFVGNGFGVRLRSPPIGMSLATPAFPTSGSACRNVTGRDVMIYVAPGAAVISAVSIGETALPPAAAIGPHLLRGTQIITFTYTGAAPTWTWVSVA